MDVRAKARDGYVNEAPVLEAFALTQPFAGTLSVENLDTTTRAVSAVALGRSRRVLLDVTGIVRANLTGRMSNYGLVLGSVTGSRDGDFTLVSGRLPDSAVGRLRIYRSRSGR